MHKQDPTRIPVILAAVQDAWEGQPDLSLASFVGMLQAHGMEWSWSDDEVLELLGRVRSTYPSLVRPPLTQPYAVTTRSPSLVVTLDGSTAVVRHPQAPELPPALWEFVEVRPLGPGRPLVLLDATGVDHRLGVVEQVRAFDPAAAPALTGLDRHAIGGARWLIALADGTRAVLGARLRVWSVKGRQTQCRVLGWRRIERCEVGADMNVAPAGGGEPLGLGPVDAIYLLEV